MKLIAKKAWQSGLQISAALLFVIALGTEARSESLVQPFIDAEVPGAEPVGSGRFSVLFWDVYAATLFAPEGKWQANSPYALSLTYLRDFDGEDIASRSVKEMRRQSGVSRADLDRWLPLMRDLFPDVTSGDTLTGVYLDNGSARFYLNGSLLGDINAPGFASRFFAIWLGEQTSEPEFRNKLLAGVAK